MFTLLLIIAVVLGLAFIVVINIIGGKYKAYVLDEFNVESRYRATVKDGKVIFKYNEASKGGIAIEKNTYKYKKQKIYRYRDYDGVLLPINDNITSNSCNLKLSTSQERNYEVEALRSMGQKANNTWWDKYSPYVFAMGIIVIAGFVAIVIVYFAFKVQPVSQPQMDLAHECIRSLQNVSMRGIPK